MRVRSVTIDAQSLFFEQPAKTLPRAKAFRARRTGVCSAELSLYLNLDEAMNAVPIHVKVCH